MESTSKLEILKEEYYVDLAGKLLITSLAAWMVGKVVNTKLRGNKEEIQTVSNVLLASRRFQDELRKPGATVDSVMEKLHVKQMTAAEFKRVFGIPWPL